MVLNILANVGILLIAIYSYFKLNNSTTQYRNYTLRQRLFYIACVSVVGMALMYQSVVIAGVRFDFRVLLFAVTTNYLGWEITVPSMMILTYLKTRDIADVLGLSVGNRGKVPVLADKKGSVV